MYALITDRAVTRLPYEIYSWYSFGLLHVWMYSLRLRGLGRTGKDSYQQIHTYIFDTIRMRIHYTRVCYSKGVARSAKSQLFLQVKIQTRPLLIRLLAKFYGMVFSLNEGLDLGDKCLAGSLTKNVLCYGYYDFTIIEHLVNYIYEELRRLEDATDYDIIKGNFRFNEIGIPELHSRALGIPK